MTAFVDNRLDLELVRLAAPFKGGKSGRLDKIAALLAGADYARLRFSLIAVVALSKVGAGDVYPTFTQQFSRPFVRFAAVLAKKLSL